ncbi:MAG: hypothetical protein K6G31_02345 [Paludibacteraceae bacterium]|jgi:hypothetical protein|nr:hypothetical protein [Paludibacteraceae bacterium]MCR5568095.1 hypothetical protein [Paludibacteraceae bacterium]
MKTKLFLIASLLCTMFNANALDIETGINAEHVILPSEYDDCDDPDCLFFLEVSFNNKKLCLDRRSEVSICTESGITIFQGERVKLVDCRNWGAGKYKVFVNGQEALHFSI